MGFFSWLSSVLSGHRRGTPAPRGRRPRRPRFTREIVGESHYQPALEHLCGGRKRRSAYLRATAYLIFENWNPHDPMAVRVDVGGMTVGYLTRDDARRFRRLHGHLVAAAQPVACEAVIVGGWYRGPHDWGHFGVKLDLPL